MRIEQLVLWIPGLVICAIVGFFGGLIAAVVSVCLWTIAVITYLRTRETKELIKKILYTILILISGLALMFLAMIFNLGSHVAIRYFYALLPIGLAALAIGLIWWPPRQDEPPKY